jgi:MFS family permease
MTENSNDQSVAEPFVIEGRVLIWMCLLIGVNQLGFGAVLTMTAGLIILSDITTVARRGRVMADYQCVFLFAVGIGPLPGGYLAETYGLAVPFAGYRIASGCYDCRLVWCARDPSIGAGCKRWLW